MVAVAGSREGYERGVVQQQLVPAVCVPCLFRGPQKLQGYQLVGRQATHLGQHLGGEGGGGGLKPAACRQAGQLPEWQAKTVADQIIHHKSRVRFRSDPDPEQQCVAKPVKTHKRLRKAITLNHMTHHMTHHVWHIMHGTSHDYMTHHMTHHVEGWALVTFLRSATVLSAGSFPSEPSAARTIVMQNHWSRPASRRPESCAK